jgi:hypothetical protein
MGRARSGLSEHLRAYPAPMIGHIPVDIDASSSRAAASRDAPVPPPAGSEYRARKRGNMTAVLPPTRPNGRQQREEPHEHAAWAPGRDEVVTPIERAGRRPHERVCARAGQPGLRRRRGQW